MRYLFLKVLIAIIATLAPLSALAIDAGYGDLAEHLFGDELVVRGIIRAICITTGVGLIVGSLFQFRKHLQNPSEVTLGTPIVSLLAGLALVALSFVPIQV